MENLFGTITRFKKNEVVFHETTAGHMVYVSVKYRIKFVLKKKPDVMHIKYI
jgi:hypothetical protein